MKRKKYQSNRIFTFNNPLAPRICPELASEIGLIESIILLQLEFWIATEGEEREGFWWIRKTVREVRETFAFLSLGATHRTLDQLATEGYVVTGQFDQRPGRGGTWYRLNIDRLKTLESIRVCSQNEQSSPSDCSTGDVLNAQNGTSVLISLKEEDNTEPRACAQEIPRQQVTEPDDELITGMIEFLEKKIGPVVSRSRETKAIKWLFGKEYDPVECEQCLGYLLSQTWRTTVITWVTVQREIGNWKRRGSPLREEPKENGGNGNQTHFETSSERNVRYIRNSLNYLNSGGGISGEGGEDNPEDETLFFPASTEYGP